MSLIQILPEDLANQIAAGEVVERPASVVKEFVENSVDAGASHITVEVEGGGTRLIRVIDNGRGMDQDDVLLCLERHATSKLRELADLASITSLGFRGEAVPSIASVSRLTITSRVEGHDLGSCAEIRFGQVRKIHEMGCRQGTIMEVRDLFANVPARKKFLKSNRTELFHVEEAVLGVALAHPAIGLRYVVGGREMLSFPPADEPARRVAFVLKQRSKVPLITVQSCHEVEDGAVAVRGWFLPPDEAAVASAKLRLFVGDRPVRDRMLSHAVSEGMQGFLPKGKRPVGVLFVDLPPESVDVNVHPAKQEVRFHKSQLIHQLVRQAIRQAMQGYQDDVKFSLFGAGRESEPATTKVEVVARESVETYVPRSMFPPAQVVCSAPAIKPAKVESRLATANTTASESRPIAESIEPSVVEAAAQALVADDMSEGAVSEFLITPRYLGQLAHSYLLCESEQGLLVIDQHAAHERLLYERLRRHYLEKRLARQALLFPEMVDCTPAQAEALEKNSQEIADLGLDIQPFGGGAWAIKAIPVLLAAMAPLDIFHGVLAQYLAGESSGGKRVEHLLSTMACKAAVKANDPLNMEEGEALIGQMMAADIFSHCPHGRPVTRLFSLPEVGRWFKRS